jgi:hypothetical protein
LHITFSQYDFQSIALHELAHAHLIGHVNDNMDLMHAVISPQSIRDISSTNAECGIYVLNKSMSFSNNNYRTIILSEQKIAGTPGSTTGNAVVCAGQNSITYSIPAIANATSYIWTIPSGAIGTSTTNSISVNYGSNAASGDLTVKGSNSCGIGTSSTLAITVKNRPVTPIITLTDNILHSNAYAGNQWYYQNTLIPGATYQNYTVTNNGDYYVVVTLSGCSSDASNTIQAVQTGIENPNTNGIIKVYPNPVSNELIIEIEGNNEKLYFEILNAVGKVIYKGDLVEKTTVQTTDFAPGFYFVKIGDGKTFDFKKIVKE